MLLFCKGDVFDYKFGEEIGEFVGGIANREEVKRFKRFKSQATGTNGKVLDI